MEPTRHSPELKPPVEDLRRHIGAVVSLNGFVEAIRDQKRMQFLILTATETAFRSPMRRPVKTTVWRGSSPS
jgi:aspartyl/asparaginyl-tRNA synthetase